MLLDRSLADKQWHKITVERTGKLLTMTVLSEGTETTWENETTTGVITGQKQILHLNQEVSKFYIGGVPDAARVCRGVAWCLPDY